MIFSLFNKKIQWIWPILYKTMLTSSICDFTLRNAIELAILMKSYLSSFRHSLSNIQ